MALRLLQVGLGGWGRNWADQIVLKTLGIEPVGFVDSDPDMRMLAQTEFGLEPSKLFNSLEAAADTTKPDAVLLVVPLAAHAAATRQALELGLHVLVEKPFTETLEEAVGLVEIAEAKGLTLLVNQNYRHYPGPIHCRRLVSEGAFGQLSAVSVDFFRLFDDRYRYFFLAEPLLSDMAIHHFDLMRFILNEEPVAASCMSWSEPETPFEGKPAAAALIRFESGIVVSYRGTWLSRGPSCRWGADWRLDGKLGCGTWTSRSDGPASASGDEFSVYSSPDELKAQQLPTVDHLDRQGSLVTFANLVSSKVSVDGSVSTGRDNLGSLALMHSLIRSAGEGGRLIELATVKQEAGL